MPITGVTRDQYSNYLANGGTFTVRLDASDIDKSGGFEKSPILAPFLDSGFELRPTALVYDDASAGPLLLHGDSWTKVVVFTYRRGGDIVYRRIAKGRYEATVSAPSQAPTAGP